MSAARRIEIIGGGLAGLSLGLALQRRGVPTTIVEAGRYPRHRVCGEFVTSLDRGTREELGLDPFLAAARPAREVVWLEPGCPPLRHHLPEPALCLSRHHWDAELATAFMAAGGTLIEGCRGPLEPAEGRVLAGGRRPDSSSPWIGLKQHFRDLEVAGDLELNLGRDAYVGLTRIENDAVNVCGLFPRHAGNRTLHSACEQAGLHSLADRLAAARPVADSHCAVAGLSYEHSTLPRGAVGLGDHHGLIPPFTGNGMTIALQTAASAVEPLARWAADCTIGWEDTARQIHTTIQRRCAPRWRRARRLHPWMLRPRRRRCLHLLHRCGLLPLAPLYRLLH